VKTKKIPLANFAASRRGAEWCGCDVRATIACHRMNLDLLPTPTRIPLLGAVTILRASAFWPLLTGIEPKKCSNSAVAGTTIANCGGLKNMPVEATARTRCAAVFLCGGATIIGSALPCGLATGYKSREYKQLSPISEKH
jgi:hypothetical protein